MTERFIAKEEDIIVEEAGRRCGDVGQEHHGAQRRRVERRQRAHRAVRAYEETGERHYLVDAGLVPRAERRRQARASKKAAKKLS